LVGITIYFVRFLPIPKIPSKKEFLVDEVSLLFSCDALSYSKLSFRSDFRVTTYLYCWSGLRMPSVCYWLFSALVLSYGIV